MFGSIDTLAYVFQVLKAQGVDINVKTKWLDISWRQALVIHAARFLVAVYGKEHCHTFVNEAARFSAGRG